MMSGEHLEDPLGTELDHDLLLCLLCTGVRHRGPPGLHEAVQLHDSVHALIDGQREVAAEGRQLVAGRRGQTELELEAARLDERL